MDNFEENMVPREEMKEKAIPGEETQEKSVPVVVPKTKSAKVPVLVGIIVVLVLGLAGVITWGVIETQKNKDDTAQNNDEQKPANLEQGELKELALDNGLVQRLYHNFDGTLASGSGGEPQEQMFYLDEEALSGNPSKEVMIGIAIEVLPRKGYCAGWNGDPAYYYDGKVSDWSMQSSKDCYAEEAVKRKIKEIFGKDVNFSDGDVAMSKYCGHYEYSARNQEFYTPAASCGGSGGTVIMRELYKAEGDADKIYLYDAVAVDGMDKIYQIRHPNSEGDLILDKDRVVYDKECTSDTDSGLWGCKNEPFDISNHIDQLDHFKWTFTKTADGDWAFAGLEQV